jgi:hypothetical protein
VDYAEYAKGYLEEMCKEANVADFEKPIKR